MPEETTVPVDGETPTDEPTTPPAAPSADEFDPERAMQTIRALREEAKAAKHEAKQTKALKERLAELERAQLTEQERIAREREEAIAERDALRERDRENQVRLAVLSRQTELGLADADLALAAIDRSRIEYDSDGQPANIAELVTELLERKPILRAAERQPTPPRIPSTDGAARDGNPPDLTADELEAAKATGMDPERYASLKRLAQQGPVAVNDAISVLSKRG